MKTVNLLIFVISFFIMLLIVRSYGLLYVAYNSSCSYHNGNLLNPLFITAVITFIYLIASLILFLIKKKSAWVAVVGYFTFLQINTLIAIYYTINGNLHTSTQITITHVQISSIPSIIVGLVAGILTLVMCIKSMRQIYQIDKTAILIALFLGALIMVLMQFGVYKSLQFIDQISILITKPGDHTSLPDFR